MLIKVNSFNNLPENLKNCSLCIGVFDGVHAGHRFEFEQAEEYAKSYNIDWGIVTFDIDPDEIYNPAHTKLLSNSDRLKILEESGCKFVVVLHFQSIKNIDAEQFLEDLDTYLSPKSIHVGKNFNFGKNAEGSAPLLKSFGQEHNTEVFVNDLVTENGHVVSSTYYRQHPEEYKSHNCSHNSKIAPGENDAAN